MKSIHLTVLTVVLSPFLCLGYKILAIFPYNGRSHHILFSSLVEELASRNHNVTVLNYFPFKNMTNIRQISIQDEEGSYCDINMEANLKSIPAASYLVNFYRAYIMATRLKSMGNDNCQKIMTNNEVKEMIVSGEKYDLVIVEQFVTDCSLAIAYKLNAPTVGMTAHILMPWTYSRLSAPNNRSFVSFYDFSTGSKSSLWKKIENAIINLAMNAYFTYAIQRSDQAIVNNIYPDVPDLEILGRSISLVLLNQYFPLTGSRLYGANVIEVGGMHVKDETHNIDKELKIFLDNANEDVIYISFGSVASNFPSKILNVIIGFVGNSTMKFVWKVDNLDNKATKNVFIRKWVPQSAVLCEYVSTKRVFTIIVNKTLLGHPNVVAFVTHSGMLSTTEAMHCGVPIVGVPLFGDQFSNVDSAAENGLGVALDIYTLDSEVLEKALQTVLQDDYQRRAKELSIIWKDRPMSAMNTAVFWIEYVARHQGRVNMNPYTYDMNMTEHLMLHVLRGLFVISVLVIYLLFKALMFFYKKCQSKTKDIKKKLKKNN